MLTTNPDAECQVCSKPFLRFLSTQKVCGVRCAKCVPVLARKAARVAQKAEIAARKVTRVQRARVRHFLAKNARFRYRLPYRSIT